FGVIACVAGVLGMLGLWGWAWWLWKRAAAPRPAGQRRGASSPDPTPGRTSPMPPPSWLFVDDDDAAPVLREHPSSTADTSRYVRGESECGMSARERTDVLADDDILEEPEPTAVGKTRKIGLFAGPRC
ncbi:MAG TPA: hypothetical protein VK034_30025, partial [Enhygromyxa sp.]|nr:hypothetical protein [Enhygromyxa sp.]